MKILVIADIHSDLEKLDVILDDAAKELPDVVICPGDVTDMYSPSTVFSQADVGEMAVQKLLAFNKNLLCVPGNQDPHDLLAVLDEYGVSLHGKTKKRCNTLFAGLGGAQTPFNTLFEPTPEETKAALNALRRKLEGKKFIMVVHQPPKDTKVDIAGNGKHVGSEEVRRFAEQAKPTLMISAHIHESAAIDKLGETTLFYPGPVFDGKYGIVELEKNKCACRMMSTKRG